MHGLRVLVAGMVALAALPACRNHESRNQEREVLMAEAIKPAGLAAFIGTWKTTGATRATAEAPSQQIDATDRYEWMEGGFFVLHYVDSRAPDAFTALEIQGHKPGGGYAMTWFDNKGGTQVMTAELNGREYRIFGPTERFVGAFSEGGETMSGTWEQSKDGKTWQPWMDITLTKVHAP